MPPRYRITLTEHERKDLEARAGDGEFENRIAEERAAHVVPKAPRKPIAQGESAHETRQDQA